MSQLSTAVTVAQGSATQLEKERAMLEQQLLALHAASHSAQTDGKRHEEQLESQVQQLQHSMQQQSTDALELTACNAGLSTQLGMLQAQHAQQLAEIQTQTATPLQKQITSLQQQLRGASNRVQGLEQQLSTQELRVNEAESRALRAEGLTRRGEERRCSLEAERRRLQQSLKELRMEVKHFAVDLICIQSKVSTCAGQSAAVYFEFHASTYVAFRHLIRCFGCSCC